VVCDRVTRYCLCTCWPSYGSGTVGAVDKSTVAELTSVRYRLTHDRATGSIEGFSETHELMESESRSLAVKRLKAHRIRRYQHEAVTCVLGTD
jgi:hypothetical protein